ncbi:hypothetical protein AVEN_17464-1 [Araneus ventricosus]|uniref:Uncharacterized protein n=1 Tax=Araneus ventricosus TaxID=182803 RepID=A0A4Y2WRR1_ARAVE|nr:hypothetical protein AVEN_17464-1 [Araneus ventricosus]
MNSLAEKPKSENLHCGSNKYILTPNPPRVPLTWCGRAGGWWKSPNAWCWAGGGWQSSTQQRGGAAVGGPRCIRADGEWVRVVRTLARDAQTLGPTKDMERRTPADDEPGSRDIWNRKFGGVSFMSSPNIVFKHTLKYLFTGAVEGPELRSPEKSSRR